MLSPGQDRAGEAAYGVHDEDYPRRHTLHDMMCTVYLKYRTIILRRIRIRERDLQEVPDIYIYPILVREVGEKGQKTLGTTGKA